MTPTREVYFNIEQVWVMYVLLAATLAVFGHGCHRRWRLWKAGAPAPVRGAISARLRRLLLQVFGHRTLLARYRAAGLFHLLLFWGFVILFAGTVVVFIHEDLGLHIMQGGFYLYFQSLALDLFGVLAVAGVLFALIHRYVFGAARLKPDMPADAGLLLLILLILLTGFLVEGLRIALTADPWAAWSPVGQWVGALLADVEDPAMRSLHRLLWWLHLLLVFGFIAWIPYSKLFHLLTAPANVFLQPLEPRGVLAAIDLERAETLGASRIEHFTWKDLLDLDSCTECGRCEVNCPAFLSGKPLSPKRLVLDLRSALPQAAAARPAAEDAPSPLVGPVIREETLWSCTTCGACMEQCPVAISQVPKIVEMRRHLVMERAEFPGDLQAALRSLEARGHPYPGSQASRTDWMQGMDIQPLANQLAAEFDVLLWVGCGGALNQRNQEVTRAIARLLQRAGVRFAVLGREERCTGDPARRAGHELLFQTLAQQNIETLHRYRVKKIVTGCPHCMNTFRHEYPQFGGQFEVVHHSELLEQLVAEGRLRAHAAPLGRVAFHDPCYLGRYNQVYEAPRALVAAAGARTTEPEWTRRNALCCGGGGGFAFMEERQGTRMNGSRARQLVATGAEAMAVGCPFCMMMIEDGVKTCAGASPPQVLDIAEVLERATRPADPVATG